MRPSWHQRQLGSPGAVDTQMLAGSSDLIGDSEAFNGSMGRMSNRSQRPPARFITPEQLHGSAGYPRRMLLFRLAGFDASIETLTSLVSAIESLIKRLGRVAKRLQSGLKPRT